MVAKLRNKVYTLDMLRDEARELVQQGVIDQQTSIYSLCRFVPEREWECIELNLSSEEFLLRDRICDLLNQERWDDD